MYALITALIQGLIFGFTMAAIPGPILFLIIQRTLRDGAFIGFLCGLGAVAADGLYALVAAVGLTIVMHCLMSYQPIIIVGGGIFLVYLGITTYLQPVLLLNSIGVKKQGAFQAWFSTFLLTLTNPVTIVSYAIIFAGLDTGSFASSLMLVLGVMLGALLVPLFIIGFLSYFHQQISTRTLDIINKIAGLLLLGFGIAAVGRGVMCMIGII